MILRRSITKRTAERATVECTRLPTEHALRMRDFSRREVASKPNRNVVPCQIGNRSRFESGGRQI